jgi:hypothetical protein
MYVYNCSSGVSAQGQTNEHTHMVAHLEFQTEDRTSEEHTYKHTRVYGCRKMHIYIYIYGSSVRMYTVRAYMHTIDPSKYTYRVPSLSGLASGLLRMVYSRMAYV